MKRFTKLSFIVLVATIIWTTIDSAVVYAQIGVFRAKMVQAPTTLKQTQPATVKQLQPAVRNMQAIQPAQSVQLPTFHKPLTVVQQKTPQQTPMYKPALPTLQPTFRPVQPTFKPVLPPVQGFKPLPPQQPRLPQLLRLNLHVCTQPLTLVKNTPGQFVPVGSSANGEKPVSGAQVQILYNANGRIVDSGTTTSFGAFATQLKPGAYKIIVTKNGFMRSETPITLDRVNRLQKIVLRPMVVLQPHPVGIPTLALRVTAPLGLSSALTKRIPGGIVPAGVIPDVDRPVQNAAIKICIKGTHTIVDSGKTDSNGVYTTKLKSGMYAIYVMKTGFKQNITPVVLTMPGVKKHIVLEPNLDRVRPVPPTPPMSQPGIAPVLPLPRPGFAPVQPLPIDDELVEKAPGIQLISPNGGETLVPGRVHEIRWIEEDETVGLPIITLLKGGAIVATYDSSEIYGTRTSAGWHWSWTVPRDIEPGDDYRIRLEATVTPENPAEPAYTVTDMSFDFFTIAHEGITIRGPRHRDTVYITRPELMSWTSVGFTGNIRIILCPEGSERAVQVLKESEPSNGRGHWTVGVGEGRGATAEIEPGRYYIRAMSIENREIYHDTPVFTIARPELRITAPVDPGYTLRGDESQRIAWTVSQMAGSVDIELWTRDVKLATVARDVRVSRLSHTSIWFPDPEGPATGSITESLRDVRVRLVSRSVPWLYFDGDDIFDVYYD